MNFNFDSMKCADLFSRELAVKVELHEYKSFDKIE